MIGAVVSTAAAVMIALTDSHPPRVSVCMYVLYLCLDHRHATGCCLLSRYIC